MACRHTPESSTSLAARRRWQRAFTATLAFLAIVAGGTIASAQTPIIAGYRDFSFGTVPHSTPTGEKPESKIWWNDGVWWGSLWSTQANGYRIYRFNVAMQSWTDAGTAIDSRPNSRADVLWDAEHQLLYIVSHVFSSSGSASSSSGNWGRLYRFSYNQTSQTYALQSGFPVNVTRGVGEALTLAKDSTQRLWVTYVEAGRVKINWSGTSDLDWGLPVNLPVTLSEISVNSDDISSVIAFGGDSVGVMWSNQNTRRTSFAMHRDVDPPTTWQSIETVLPDSNCSGACADDHMNLKATSDGKVFAALKTSLGTGEPLIMLGVRSAAGAWATYTYGLGENHHTRPIVQIDEGNDRLYMFATTPESGGALYYKTSPLNNISFASGLGTVFIDSAADSRINNASSTKQNVNATTGLLVIACDQDSHFYFHNYIQLGPGPQAPAAPTGLTATAVSATRIDLAWRDNSSDETGFSVERDDGGGFTPIVTPGANATAFSDATVSPGTAYAYRVRAVNTGVFSGYSNQASATTPPAGPVAPAAPSGLAASTVTSSAVTLTWTDNSNNETAFHVERATSGGAFAEITGSPVGSNVTTLADSSVAANTSYTYRVRAENTGLFSGYSAELPVTTPGTNPTSSLKDATFEGGLTNPGTGVDSVAGTVTLETATPLKGTRSARIATTSSWLEETFAATNDLYVSFYLRLNALPTADARLVLISNAGTTVGNLLLRTTGALRLRNNSTVIGADSPALTVGALYRVGVHQQRGTGTDALLEAFLATGDNAFTTPFARTTTGTWTTATDRFRLGATTGTVNVVVDDLRLDAFAMPAPSGQGAPNAPAAPTALTADATGPTQIALAWADHATDETGYSVERSDAGSAFAVIASPAANATSFSDTTVAAATAYTYRVRAVNSGVFSGYSNDANATTPALPVAPSAPTTLVASSVTATAVTLTWSDTSANETAFHIERATNGAFAEIAASPVGIDVTTVTDSTVAANTAYTYRVRAENTGAFSGYSNALPVTTPPAGGSGSSLKDATFEGGLTDPGTGVDSVAGTVTLETATPLKGTRSARIATTSSWLEETFAATNDLYVSFYLRLNALPTADARLVLISNAGTTVGNLLLRTTGALRLRNNSTVIGADSPALTVGALYRVGVHQHRGTGTDALLEAFLATGDNAFTTPFARTTTGTWTTATDRFRLGATTGTVNVVVDDLRLDAFAMPAPSGQGAPNAPAAPTALTADATGPTQIALAWADHATDETGYSVERSDAGSAFAVIASPAANATSFSDTTVAAATAYTYRVRAVNSGVFSGYSNDANATTPALPVAPSAPTTLVASSVTATAVTLTWSDTSANETAFHIERATNGAFAEIAASPVGIDVTTVTDSTVAANTAYTYRVRAENTGAFSGYSNALPVTTPPAGGSGSSLKDATFEGGLTNPGTGVDSVAGTVTLETATPLKGTRSARIATTSSWLEETFAATNDLYVSFYLRLNALPTADARLVLISNAGTTVGNLLLRTTGALRLRNSSTTAGVDSAPLAVGALYRVGVHQQRGTGTDALLEAFLATGDNAFTTPFARMTTGTWTTATDRFRLGATTGTVNVVVDDLRLDAFAMPSPSP